MLNWFRDITGNDSGPPWRCGIKEGRVLEHCPCHDPLLWSPVSRPPSCMPHSLANCARAFHPLGTSRLSSAAYRSDPVWGWRTAHIGGLAAPTSHSSLKNLRSYCIRLSATTLTGRPPSLSPRGQNAPTGPRSTVVRLSIRHRAASPARLRTSRRRISSPLHAAPRWLFKIVSAWSRCPEIRKRGISGRGQ